ncbi:maleylpyruvate isomerase family mycothiol-dependent enzyme [Natronosporangium hydrolyticum]|uniref:Maleylpyruvate isomerase family mycothiol-dependent enzyme n=1 Tax=Natronosporangium hydrolyticum TaxID=2811111 RepID=A0A895YIS9_9ACTN|nr:maleylpyruvate isomerase family mycothiol-dependent enzyme [Natronosporangium hydrolyticum]QSB15942.1 maleylpyruvate isomerase family mycothiol-dependent enzyme [Natronosporangium hydrolyticum]
MTARTKRAITVLRDAHEDLVTYVSAMPPSELKRSSAASEWSIAQVLSHLGSGAEIMRGTIEATLAGDPPPESESRHAVWDRWNAMPPQEQADTFVSSNELLLGQFEEFDDEQLERLRIDLGFLPEPVDVLTTASLRLHEFVLHSWDVKVVSRPTQTLTAAAVEFLFQPVDMLIGWIGQPVSVAAGAVVSVRTEAPTRSFGLELSEPVRIVDPPSAAEATLTIPAEAFIRLVTGRLALDHTPAEAVVEGGELTLDHLRETFPGY